MEADMKVADMAADKKKVDMELDNGHGGRQGGRCGHSNSQKLPTQVVVFSSQPGKPTPSGCLRKKEMTKTNPLQKRTFIVFNSTRYHLFDRADIKFYCYL